MKKVIHMKKAMVNRLKKGLIIASEYQPLLAEETGVE